MTALQVGDVRARRFADARSQADSRRTGPLLCGVRIAGLLLAAVLGAGCAPAALLTYRPDQPLTANLPLARAGIDDARPAFAKVLAAELAGTTDVSAIAWLPAQARDAMPAIDHAAMAARFTERAPSTSVLIAPGLFGDCVSAQSVPFGDGVLRAPDRSPVDAYRQYDALGLRSIRTVPLPGRASSEVNGGLLAEAIRAEAARPGVQRIIVIGYSKGMSDLLHALALLARDGSLPRSLVAVVSVAGAVTGTPLADYYQPTYDAISPRVTPLDCTPSQGGDLGSLTRRERVAWLAANPLPAGPAYYSIVAHTVPEEMSPALRWPSRLLAAIEPRNDGQLVAADALLPGSTLLLEARSDHWDLALPLDRHPDAALRALTSGRAFPREALFAATVKWALGQPQ
jgi:hypothetical protein